MTEFKNKNITELRNMLLKLRATFSTREEASDTQRLIRDLKVQQIEKEIQSREFQEIRKQLENACDRYAELYDFAPVAYVTFDEQARITELNLAAAKLFGQPRQKVVNQPISQWLDDEQYPRLLEHLYQVSFSRKKITTEIKLKRKDGSIFFVCLESIALRGNDGVATHCQTAILDITERKRAEETLQLINDELEARVIERTRDLQHANESLQKEIVDRAKTSEKIKQAAIVFDNTEEGIIFLDKYFKIINVNHSFCNITGHDEDELVGKNPKQLLTKRNGKEQFSNIMVSLATNDHWKGEVWYQCKNGDQTPVWENINVVKNEQGDISHYVVIVTDITSLKETEQRLEHLAHHDALTGLSNRLHFTANLEGAMKRTQRRHKRFALLLLDLDNFKQINDTFGHSTGDTLLKIIAERLQDCVRNEDTVARLGGDEFTIILEDINEFDDARLIANKILASISQTIEIEGKEIFTHGSIGVGIYPDDAEYPEDLIKAADVAMYRAKDQGGNNAQFFTTELTIHAVKHVNLENQLRDALNEHEFEVYYQPQVILSEDKVVGMEALVRWNHKERGLLAPSSFIAAAEESGLIDEIDEWVLNTACAQVKSWQLAGIASIRVCINLAGRTLTHNHNIVNQVRTALETNDLQPDCLELEIPERILQNTEKAINILNQLKALGVKLSIDDFGTGNSSLTSLKQMPIDTLKIDRSFVSDIPNNPNDAALASAIIAMGHNLKMRVTAEGVGTQEQLSFLRDQGCDQMQGFYFSEPIPSDVAKNFIERNRLN